MTTSDSKSTKPSSQGEKINPYAARVLGELKARYPWEREFIAAVDEVFQSLGPVLEDSPVYESERILERITEPERILSFKVAWLDDAGKVQMNRAWRVQWSSSLGPYKGGTRFHSSVTLDGLKFLAFEQTFKNSLTSLPLGSGKGGSDFHPGGKSHREVMRFCQAYMNELYRHIGPDEDVPAGDIGVGGREIGYLFGQYKKLTHLFNGVLTGKAHEWGGSLLRPEATGFGVAYFANEMLKARGESMEGKVVAASGFGNVAWGLVKKAGELGAKVVTVSGPDGFVHDKDGIKGEKIEFLLGMRSSGRDKVQDYADKFKVPFFAGKRPWGVPCDLAFPCAIQHELDLEDAKALAANGCKALVEGANMPTAPEAVPFLEEKGITYVPGKAANAGGVACSGLEMSQNGAHEYWTAEEVDKKLKQIMVNIHNQVASTAERFGLKGSYLAGANIAGFVKVARAMLDQGI
ncbi:MAG: NADP-specific glutamate dehydrogenase [Polyangia bacterium]|jgi:glutamate dehydrogenase (NADP+)|nr:NADP-specific glutamate dehydrogenase [Polyangia bacterium]